MRVSSDWATPDVPGHHFSIVQFFDDLKNKGANHPSSGFTLSQWVAVILNHLLFDFIPSRGVARDISAPPASLWLIDTPQTAVLVGHNLKTSLVLQNRKDAMVIKKNNAQYSLNPGFCSESLAVFSRESTNPKGNRGARGRSIVFG